MVLPPHHHLANSLTSSETEYASSTSSSRASSPRSSQSQNRSNPAPFQANHHRLEDDEDDDDQFSRPSSEDLRYSDSYDSSADSRQGGGGRVRIENPLTPSLSTVSSTASLVNDAAVLPAGGISNNLAVDHHGVYGHHMWSDSSRVSSRAASPAPGQGDGFDGYLSYSRAGTTGARLVGAAARSRSGFSTPTTPAELEEKDSAYDTEGSSRSSQSLFPASPLAYISRSPSQWTKPITITIKLLLYSIN